MPSVPFTRPVTDTIGKVRGDIAVGENLDFQRKWWRFERLVWCFFLLILIADLVGLFGRGPLARAHRSAANGSLLVDYERIQRAGTPSMLTLHFAPATITDGHISLFVSDSLIQKLGAQRISPQPEASIIGEGGVTYRWAANQSPATVQFTLSPSFPGTQAFTVHVAGNPAVAANVFVVP